MIIRAQVRQIFRTAPLKVASREVASSSQIQLYCTCSTHAAQIVPTPTQRRETDRRRASTSSQNNVSRTVETSPFPVFNSIADFRRWRAEVAAEGRTVGFVPTMGALHEGHLNLVRESLAENDETVVSIFVNPAQFAPSEDLASYPRTLSSDIEALSSLHPTRGRISAIFAPTVAEMYPSPDGQPFTQHVRDQVGAFVEVQGLQNEMEGTSRPTFFRGVATVCTKLFHVVQPKLAYFGQKDIQQAVILRRLVSDLLFSHPPSAQAIRVIKTTRDAKDGLALSSRNAYLTEQSRRHASILYKALSAARDVWDEQERSTITKDLVESTLMAARKSAQEAIKAAQAEDVSIEVLYISLNDPTTLQDLSHKVDSPIENRGAILSAAALIKQGQQGRATRLIDNFLLGFSM